ncbi:MATE family efflux transporter [Clostridium perfringens]|nr:MATE family efflux transporter [Clostridium perfringens]
MFGLSPMYFGVYFFVTALIILGVTLFLKKKLVGKDRDFYKVLLVLCIPIIVQNFISTSVNVIDTVMISSLGEESIAAVGVANQVFFLFNMGLIGLTGATGLFISQFYGSNDRKSIKKVMGLSTILCLGFSFIFFVLAFFFPELIIGIFSTDPKVVELCKSYLVVIAISYPLTALSMVISAGARAVRNPKLGMFCSGASLIINIIFNYCLIFGIGIFPELGVKGAAISTVFARIIECLLLVGYVILKDKDYIIKFNINDIKGINKDFFKVYMSKGMPIFINDFAWAIGSVSYSVAYAMVGTSAIAASQIATSTANLFIMLAMCIATGAAIMLGNELGADNTDRAIDYSNKFSKIVFVVGSILGGMLILSIPILLKVYSTSSTMAGDLTKIFVIMGVLMGLKSFNILVIVGILRSGGDTKYAFALEFGCMWLVSIPLTFFGAINGFPIYMLVLFTYSEEIVKAIFGLPRVLSKVWVVNLTKDIKISG